MSDLVEFLLAREAERLAEADQIHHAGCGSRDGECNCGMPKWVRADVQAKRKIVERLVPRIAESDRACNDEWNCNDDHAGDLLRTLALPYAAHPAYQEAWHV